MGGRGSHGDTTPAVGGYERLGVEAVGGAGGVEKREEGVGEEEKGGWRMSMGGERRKGRGKREGMEVQKGDGVGDEGEGGGGGRVRKGRERGSRGVEGWEGGGGTGGGMTRAAPVRGRWGGGDHAGALGGSAARTSLRTDSLAGRWNDELAGIFAA